MASGKWYSKPLHELTTRDRLMCAVCGCYMDSDHIVAVAAGQRLPVCDKHIDDFAAAAPELTSVFAFQQRGWYGHLWMDIDLHWHANLLSFDL